MLKVYVEFLGKLLHITNATRTPNNCSTVDGNVLFATGVSRTAYGPDSKKVKLEAHLTADGRTLYVGNTETNERVEP